jgi:glycosyltransferase involved in cell wall biosynthesis
LTNILAPYRIPIFERMAESFDILVLHSSLEANRASWKHLASHVARCRTKRSWGITVPLRYRTGKWVYDHRYLHINPGFFMDLVREKPDAVISGEMGFRTFAALLYARLFRKPLWVLCEDTPHAQRHAPWWKRAIRRWFARRNVRWISHGVLSTGYLRSLGVAGEGIVQVQNCVDESRFGSQGPARFTLSPRPVVLSVGRLVSLKGFDALFRAAARVQSAGHTFSLLVVGEGPEESNLRRLAGDLGLRNVHFRGNHAPEVMDQVYRSGDIFVFPTREDVWGLAVCEALLCGLPVLCSIHAGCAPDIVPRENQFDPDNLAEFEAVLTRAIAGSVAPADCSCLWKICDVADAIVNDVWTVLQVRRRGSGHCVDARRIAGSVPAKTFGAE